MEVEVKPKRVSILENLRGLDLFGKGGEEVEEKVAEPINVEPPKKAPMEIIVADPKPIEIKPKFPTQISTIRIQNLPSSTVKVGNNIISGENLALRFIPISDVCTTILTANNIKLL